MAQEQAQRTEALSYTDRVTIAAVLTWDNFGNVFSPDEIEAIRIDSDMVRVKLSPINGKPREWVIHRNVFRNILEQQRAACEKQIQAIVEIENQEVLETERETIEIHAQTIAESDSSDDSSDNWLTEPIGANPNRLFGVPTI